MIEERRMIKIQPFTISELQKTIKDWNINQRVSYLVYSSYFKYALKHHKDIEESFIKNCIIHFLILKFSSNLIGDQKEELIKKNFQIKQEYKKLYHKGTFKSDFKFYFLIILITKLISQFIKYRFSSIKIDYHIQSQIFITLISTILGIQVGQQSYKLQKNKYLQKTQPSIKDQIKTPKNHQLNNSELSTTKKRIALLYDSKDQVKFELLIKQKNMGNLAESNFESELRKNLYVEPLPIIKNKQYTLREVEFNNQQKKQSDQYLDDIHTIERKINKRFITSNQLSDLTIRLNSLKSFKIPYKPQHCSSLYKITKRKKYDQKPLEKVYCIETTNDNEQYAKGNTKKWQKIITQLKQNIDQNQKLRIHFVQKKIQQPFYSMRKSRENSNPCLNSIIKKLSKVSKIIKIKEPISYNPKNIIKKEKICKQQIEKGQKIRISKKKLQNSYEQFLQSCAHRERLSKCQIPPIHIRLNHNQ